MNKLYQIILELVASQARRFSLHMYMHNYAHCIFVIFARQKREMPRHTCANEKLTREMVYTPQHTTLLSIKVSRVYKVLMHIKHWKCALLQLLITKYNTKYVYHPPLQIYDDITEQIQVALNKGRVKDSR